MSHHQQKSHDLIGILEPHFAKLPHLPKKAQDVLVQFIPYVALLFGILGIFGAISSLGILTATSPFAIMGGAEGVSAYGGGFIASLFWMVSAGLLLAAYPGLNARKFKGWNLLFWSEIVNLIGCVIAMTILSGIISTVIWLYILYEIKSHYK